MLTKSRRTGVSTDHARAHPIAHSKGYHHKHMEIPSHARYATAAAIATTKPLMVPNGTKCGGKIGHILRLLALVGIVAAPVVALVMIEFVGY